MRRIWIFFFGVLVTFLSLIFQTSGIEQKNKVQKKIKETKHTEQWSKRKPLVGYLKDGKWHFLDNKGNLLFEPLELLDVLGYNEGYFRVNIEFNKKPKWAIIDLFGNITVIDGINYLFDFYNGRALVVKLIKKVKEGDTNSTNEQLFGYINYQGKLVIPLIYEDATEFSEGLAFVKNKEIRGFIDTNNNLIIKMENSAGNKFKEGLADINDRQFRIGFMNKKGEIVVPLEFDLLEHFSEGLAFAIKGDKAGFINKKGEFEFFVDGYTSKPFSDSMAFIGKLIKQKIKWALINRKGEKITDFIFDDVREFSEGVAPVMKDGRYFFIDKTGAEILHNDYYYVDKFIDSLAWASLRNGQRGYIDHSGKFVITVPEAEKYFDFRLKRKVY
ncbi:MAG: WG repeat-containing protein [Ignavibacteria bacterium]|nr:WG repeat-containing protein [Ignavibacteria bacterium]